MGFLNLLGIQDLTGGNDNFMPSLGSDYIPVSTGASSSTINFAKGDNGNGLLKAGLIAAAILLGLLVMKRKK